MLNNLLEEIVISIVGKQAVGIVELLNTSKYVNEFIIAKKLGITINQTRNMLYKISDYGLVSSVRKKDKKKGWYTYFWKFEILKCLEFLKDLLLKNKNQIEGEISSRKSKVFYVCESCGLEYNEDEALLMDFICDECGEVFTVKDGSKLIRDLEKTLFKISEKLKIVEIEVVKEQSKLDKKKELESKKEKKEKEKIKQRKKEERKQAKAKNLPPSKKSLGKEKKKSFVSNKKAVKKKSAGKKLPKKTKKATKK
ncbi:hypothetical protein COU58_01615 [Candidatus Pacearchaeota archaeon CG10_big_fil_rev_8_21_14_0_10_32_42]|nr:MAG: hypothetical protein COU58_01615 [Candidatus Pacearchaeota archaeon CG10_big_fil_rev_8_21_14_0_10_32_42]